MKTIQIRILNFSELNIDIYISILWYLVVAILFTTYNSATKESI